LELASVAIDQQMYLHAEIGHELAAVEAVVARVD
jgi:hypothetical protein